MTVQERAEVSRLVNSSLSIMEEAGTLGDNLAGIVGTGRTRVDPSIRAGQARFLARVLVTITRPDGSRTTVVVSVPFDGPTSGYDIIAAAIAAAQGNALVPPPPGRPGLPQAATTYTATIYTVGRGSPALGF